MSRGPRPGGRAGRAMARGRAGRARLRRTAPAGAVGVGARV